LLVIAADVQKRGIYYTATAFSGDRQAWIIEFDFLEGETFAHDAGAWLEFEKVFQRRWPTSNGTVIAPQELGIDAAFNTGAVYTWVRNHPGTKALRGLPGWGKPPLSVGTEQEIDYRGRRIRGGARLRGVGGWNLKMQFYSALNLTAQAEGSQLKFSPGYWHLGDWADEILVKQLTAEALIDVKRGRGTRKEWTQLRPDNHALDCAILSLAMADPWWRLSPEDWAKRQEAWHGAVDAEALPVGCR
jgi:phage terminase large subunit GpA-like protein